MSKFSGVNRYATLHLDPRLCIRPTTASHLPVFVVYTRTRQAVGEFSGEEVLCAPYPDVVGGLQQVPPYKHLMGVHHELDGALRVGGLAEGKN
jgi:hypothetical protein